MDIRFRPARALSTLVILTLLSSACSSKSPASPSDSPGVTGATSGPAGSTAVINGSVQSGGTGMSVSVAGTAIVSNADATGNFALTGVPTGDVQLRFSGAGADATVPVQQIQPLQNITLVVAVAGGTASVETEMRTGSGEAELDARIESLPPTTAAGTLKAGGRLVKTAASTQIEQQGIPRTFADLTVGLRIHVKGSASGSDILASRISMASPNSGPSNPTPGPSNPNPNPSPNPNPTTPTPSEVELQGAIDGLSGSASAFQFSLGGKLIKGDATTVLVGEDKTVSFSSLKNGEKVEVKGQQLVGFVAASRIHIEDEPDHQPTPANPIVPAEVTGTLTAKTGTAPNLTLTVGTTTVKTSSATELESHGVAQSLGSLQIGQTLKVEGTRQADNSILAREIEVEEDEDEVEEAEIEGAMSGLTGTCPAITFTVRTTMVTTSSATEFKDTTCAALKNLSKVEVKGSKKTGGSIAATRIRPKS